MSDLQPDVMPIGFECDENGVRVTYFERRKTTLHVKDMVIRDIDPTHPLLEPLIADLLEGLRELIDTAGDVQAGTPDRIQPRKRD